jgi:hypothetical protein
VEVFRLKPGASRDSIALSDEIRVKGGRRGKHKCILALLSIKLVTHVLGEFLKLTFRLCIVGVDHEILQVPEMPRDSRDARPARTDARLRTNSNK